MAAAARERETSVKGSASRPEMIGKSAYLEATVSKKNNQSESSSTQKGGKRGRKSISVISPASVPKVRREKILP